MFYYWYVSSDYLVKTVVSLLSLSLSILMSFLFVDVRVLMFFWYCFSTWSCWSPGFRYFEGEICDVYERTRARL